MKWLHRVWRQFWCKHQRLTTIRNIHGDEIVAAGFNRSWRCCDECGKEILHPDLDQSEEAKARTLVAYGFPRVETEAPR